MKKEKKSSELKVSLVKETKSRTYDTATVAHKNEKLWVNLMLTP